MNASKQVHEDQVAGIPIPGLLMRKLNGHGTRHRGLDQDFLDVILIFCGLSQSRE